MKYLMEGAALKYLLEEFPKGIVPELWNTFELECEKNNIVSDKQTSKMLEMELSEISSLEWLGEHSGMFLAINEKESIELGEMMRKGFFNYYENCPRLTERKLPEGFPFILAMAKVNDQTVVYRKNGKDSALVINLCRQAKVACIEVETMMLNLKHA